MAEWRIPALAVLALLVLAASLGAQGGGELVWCIEEFEPEEEFSKCGDVQEAATLVPGKCGLMSIAKGDYREDDDDWSWKACSYLLNLGKDAYVGQVCVDKGYGSMSPNRPELNLPPCEDNPPVEGGSIINAGMIPGLKKVKFESEAEVDELNVSLLDCPEDGGVNLANYENMAEYVDKTILYYENFLRFFKEVNNDLSIVDSAVKKQCSLCESGIEELEGKYGICGLPKLDMAKLPAPTVCWAVAKPFCEQGAVCNEGSAGSAGNVKVCPMCTALPCDYGKECKLGLPSKEKECWKNENFCGTDDTIGAPEDDFGAAGCKPEPDPASVERGGCCMVAQALCQAQMAAYNASHAEWEAEQGPKEAEPKPPACSDIYQFTKAPCYTTSASKVIAEAWRTLQTESSKRAAGSPAGVRECEKKLADLRDVCELDRDHIACDVARELKLALKYLKNLLAQMPKAIGQLKAVRAKFQASLERGASYVEIKRDLDELVAIMAAIDKLERSADEEELDSDRFQRLLTKLVAFFQTPELYTDLTRKHPWSAVACKLEPAGFELEFPDGTPEELRHKADAGDKWGAFCSRFNVLPGEGAAADEQGFALAMMQQNAEGFPKPGCGGYRGGCAHADEPFNWRDQNMDEWGEVHMSALQEFRELDVRDMFVDSGSCFEHKVPTVSMCEDICRQCHGTAVAHCHAQLGLCVCRLGSERRLTAYDCQEPMANDTERAQFQACCEGLFADVAASGGAAAGAAVPGTGAAPAKRCIVGKDKICLFDRELCAAPEGVLAAGPVFDYCQTTSSETGMCCTFGFEERPISYACAESASCRRACHERFRGNAPRVEGCTMRCMAADVACERRCLAESLDAREARRCIQGCWKAGERAYDEDTVDCVQACRPAARDPRAQEVCQRLCKALAPDLAVRLAALRGASEVQAFYAGESLRFRAAVENDGFLPFRGRAEVRLKLLEGCDCPPCPADAVCECACSEAPGAVLATIPVPLVEAGEAATLLSDPKPIAAELAGKLVQPVLELFDEDGRLVGGAMGPISKVLAMGKVAVIDAWFTVDGERATQAYAGSRVKGSIEVRSALFPLTFEVAMVDAEGRELEGSRSSVEVADPLDGARLDTLEVETPARYVGFIVRLRVEARDSKNATVIAETLVEQGLASGVCSGEVMTSWCKAKAVEFRMDYPDAYLEVKRPELQLKEAVFETREGLTSPVLYEPMEVRASVSLSGLATIPFEGTVTVSVLDEWSLAVNTSVLRTRASIARGKPVQLGSAFFMTAPQGAYAILVQATDDAGREWAVTPTASGLVGADVFPMSRLEVREKGVVQGESAYIYQSIEYSDCNIRVACEDCLPTCTLWLDRKACSIRSDPGTCACECVTSAT